MSEEIHDPLSLANLSRLEIRANPYLVRRLPNVQLETEALEWQAENPIFHGLKSLPVVFN